MHQQYLFYSLGIHENTAEDVYDLDLKECQSQT